MKHRMGLAARRFVLLFLLGSPDPEALAQGAGTSGSLSGTVADSSGAILPGVTIVAKNNATAAETTAVSDEGGRFVIPALEPGTYSVTISLAGFKSVVLPDVPVMTATPSTIRPVLEVGALEETVVVTGASEMVQTKTTAVQTTVLVQQIQALPLITRNTLDFVTMLPGVNTTTTNRNSNIAGLPSTTINITLDGVNVQDNNNRNGDGFFTYINPRLDSIEEVTVSTSTPGAESAGQGAVQIRFATRSGTNRFTGALYNSWRNQAGTNDDDVLTREKKPFFLWRLNTPYWFNKRDIPKQKNGENFIDDVRLQQPGFRLGGPIYIPKVFDGHDKAFFFFNWEWFSQPIQVNRTRTILHPLAQQGTFQYNTAGGVQQVNLLALAAANGQTSTVDPTLSKLYADIRSASEASGGGITPLADPNVQRLTYSPGGTSFRYFPTVRIDVNATRDHRLSFTGRYNMFDSTPDFLNSREPRFPGFPNVGGQTSDRYSATAALRSVFGGSVVNEARWGWSGGTTYFFADYNAGQFSGNDVGNQGGFDLNFGGTGATQTLNLTTATNGVAPSSRFVPAMVIEDSLNWVKGAHNLSMGGSFTRIDFRNWDQPRVVPRILFNVDTTDPANAMFTTGNFPGASTTDLNNARYLYAVLTGRVTEITATAVLTEDGQYVYNGERWQRGAMNEMGLYVADTWSVRPGLTINAGVRWELQFPFEPDNDSYARLDQVADIYGISGDGNLFKPGTLAGRRPFFVQYQKGDSAYNMDWNNVAPSVGAAWRPYVGSGWLSRILSSEPVFRGGYSVSYNRYGVSDFTSIFGANPGSTKTANRSLTLGNLVTNTGTDRLPLLLRESNRLGPPSFPAQPSYPLYGAVTEVANVFDANIEVPYTHSFSFGWQRELGRTMGLEVRYVGNRNKARWVQSNLNAELNIVENGFTQEFRQAQANLQANIAAGRGNTFRYFGPGTGTSPLPIYLAHFSGVPASQAGDASLYTSTNFTSTTFVNHLATFNPLPLSAASQLGTANATFRTNAFQTAGLPVNFWVVNPDLLGGSWLQYNAGDTSYDALQIELRRRMSNGLLLQGSYVWGRQMTSTRPTLRDWFLNIRSTDGVDHAFKLNWVYELPFGRGRTLGSGVSGFVNALIGGWEFDGQGRVQSGRIFSFGNVRLVGMSDSDLKKMFKVYKVPDANGVERVYMLPQDVINNTIKAFSVSATSPTGYGSLGAPSGSYLAPANGPDCLQAFNGQCAPLNHFVTGPMYTRFDWSFVKRFYMAKGMGIELRMDLLNVFDNINFTPVTYGGTAITSSVGTTTIPGTSLTNYEVTAAARDINGSQDPGGRVTSFGVRFTW
jgi:hypothetical protein